jgi:glyoxylase-like metal-dependent hydrolase (beta-lactamase superfamily II)
MTPFLIAIKIKTRKCDKTMIIQTPGPVSERIWLLGRPESCVYFVDGGDQCALLGGGLTYIIPNLLHQISELGLDQSLIRRLVIHHSHFDHVGLIPFLQKRLPQALVTASIRARELLSRREVMKSIVDFNRLLLSQQGLDHFADEWQLTDTSAIDVQDAVADGQRRTLGDLTLEFFETPGHSSCSLSVYIAELKVLATSDAGGIPYGDNIFTAANSNFDQYQASLEKMSKYDVEVHLAEHYGACTGEDGRTYINRSMETARQTRKLLEETFARTRDEAQTTEEITSWFSQAAAGYFLPSEIMAMVAAQMTRFIAGKFAQSHREPA